MTRRGLLALPLLVLVPVRKLLEDIEDAREQQAWVDAGRATQKRVWFEDRCMSATRIPWAWARGDYTCTNGACANCPFFTHEGW